MNELRIGICDDEVEYQKILHNICEEYFDRSEMKHLYTFFNNGEEVIKFCEDKSKQIDLLFLDVEMGGIDVKPHFIPDDFCKLFQSKSPVIKCGNDNDSKLFQS